MWGSGIPEQTIVIHVRGVDPARNIDGTKLPDMALVAVGKHSYVNATGARRTVQSFARYQPLTRVQFEQALRDGFQLIDRRIVKIKRTENVAISTGFSVSTAPRVVEEEKVIATPVP